MASQVPNKKAPFRSPTWLSDAAKKRTGAPPQAFLDRLQFAREHPVEFQKELREKAVQAGQDPDAFAKSMAEQNKTTRPVSLNLLAEVVNSPLVKEAQTATLQSEGSVDIPAMSRSLPQCSWTSPQPRLGTKGQITKLPQSKPDARDRRTSSASRTSSSMEMDQPHPIAESSASGPARMTESAGSSDTYAAAQPTAQLCPFPARSQLPNWHTSISQKSLVLLERQRPRPQALTAIDALKACIGRCEKNGLPKDFKDLRDYVHKAEIMLEMDKFKVRKTRILTGDGLPRIFGEDADFPWDLKADAWHLYERWVVEDFDNNILRGIVTVKAKDRNGDRLDSTYRNKHPRDPKVFGDNGAVLGQWWPSQLCAVRDGIHGAPQAGKLYFTLFLSIALLTAVRHLWRQGEGCVQHCTVKWWLSRSR
jgi:hypothetical protein